MEFFSIHQNQNKKDAEKLRISNKHKKHKT